MGDALGGPWIELAVEGGLGAMSEVPPLPVGPGQPIPPEAAAPLPPPPLDPVPVDGAEVGRNSKS